MRTGVTGWGCAALIVCRGAVFDSIAFDVAGDPGFAGCAAAGVAGDPGLTACAAGVTDPWFIELGAWRATFWRSCASVCVSSGRPGFFARASCFASNGTGFGGGAVCDTTGRAIACVGGSAACTPAFAPRTLVFAGATGADIAKASGFTALGGTATAALATGCELVIALVGTAVTAPLTVWFA